MPATTELTMISEATRWPMESCPAKTSAPPSPRSAAPPRDQIGAEQRGGACPRVRRRAVGVEEPRVARNLGEPVRHRVLAARLLDARGYAAAREPPHDEDD